jgi:CRP-like cAMP-binding protein
LLGEKPELRGVRDRVLQLRALPGLSALDEDALVLLAEDAKVRFFEREERLLRGDRPVDRVHLVTRGRVRVERAGALVGEVTEGEVGLLSVLAGDAAPVEATALEPTATLELPADAVHRNLQESFAITRNTMRQLARQLLERRGHLPASPDRAVDAGVDLGIWRTRALTMVEKLLLLRATPFGRLANLDAAAEMARAMVEVRLHEGELLWDLGDPATSWIRVEYGRVRCTAADGRSVDVGAGFVLGILDGWGDLPRSYRAVAGSELIVQRMDLAAQLALLETHTTVAAQATRFLAKSLLGA